MMLPEREEAAAAASESDVEWLSESESDGGETDLATFHDARDFFSAPDVDSDIEGDHSDDLSGNSAIRSTAVRGPRAGSGAMACCASSGSTRPTARAAAGARERGDLKTAMAATAIRMARTAPPLSSLESHRTQHF